MITRRCTQRQLLLRPDAQTNNAFTYCLAEAAQRFGIDVILPSAMSNHHHTCVFDRRGVINEFNEHFHKMLAKCMNSLRGRWENFWSSEQVCNVRCVNREDVMRKLVYAATNPVKDRLVETVREWPGVNGLYPLLDQELMIAYRPTHFFSATGKMPSTVSLHLVVPPELGDVNEVLMELRERVAAFEAAAAIERKRGRTRVLGRRKVLAQSWRDIPKTREPRRDLRPTIAAKSKWSRIEEILRDRMFLAAYREARRRWLALDPIPFPAGTYWLKRFMNVPIETTSG